MKRELINKAWTFQYGEPSFIPGMPAKTKEVDLPYDFIIENDVTTEHSGAEVGFYPGKTGSYTKYIEVSKEDLDKKHILYIEGCFGSAKIVVNGNLIRRHHYGYSPFYVDLSSYINEGRNRITITASNDYYPNSRWYSGAGLYRNVYLLTSEKTYIKPDGIYTYVKEIKDGKATLIVRTTICNETDKDISLTVKASVNKKANPFIENDTEERPFTSSKDIVIEANSEKEVTEEVIIENVKIWDIEHPYLYHVSVTAGNDEANVTTGIRTIEVDAVNGFRLNGKTIKLKGGCVHHDNGIIGSAAYKDAEYRKVLLHKNAGFNALRFSHNPVSEDMLNACDEIGLLVIDEAFDTFEVSKNYNDFANFFEYEWEKEMVSFITRDRNHPCIFMWSIGNEIPEQTGTGNGGMYAKLLSDKVRSLDSTRFVGGALCSFFNGLNDADNKRFWDDIMKNSEKLRKNGAVNLDSEFGKSIWREKSNCFGKNYDIVGYNYLNYQFEPTHEMYPERVMCTTESKPLEFYRYWKDALRLSYVIGDFEWTSIDYIGEAGIGNTVYVPKENEFQTRMMMNYARYPMRLAGCGDFDLCGFVKPQLAYKQIVWGSRQTYVVSHNPVNYDKVEIIGRYGWSDCNHNYSWPQDEGCPVKIEVYSNAYKVKLFVNDTLIGEKIIADEDEYKAMFETSYKKGTVTAVSYDEKDNEISRDSISSSGSFDHFEITQDETNKEVQSIIKDNGNRLYYVAIKACDKENNPLDYGEYRIKASVEGNAKLLALGTGRLATEENYTKGEITTYKGQAMAAILADNDDFKLNIELA